MCTRQPVCTGRAPVIEKDTIPIVDIRYEDI